MQLPGAKVPADTRLSGDDGWDSSLERLWELEQNTVTSEHLSNLKDGQHRFTADSLANTAAAGGAAASQRRAQNRKLAQKRYRQRQKERETAKIEDTRSQLQLSLRRQAALECDILRLQIQVQSNAATPQKSVRHYWPVNMPNELKVLVDYTVQMKLPNESVCLETTELSKLSLAKWKQLYQATVCGLQNALDRRPLNHDASQNMQQLKQLTLQANCLLLSLMTNDLPTFTQLHQTGLDNEHLVSEVSEDLMAAKLDALDYTDEQVADLLLLKSLVLTKLQEIDQVRTDALITAAQHAKAGTARLDAAHEVTTARLDALSAQTFQTYVEFGLAFRLGIHTTRQLAVGLVYSYPRLFGLGDIEALETRLMPAACKGVSPAAAVQCTWNDVTKYLQAITYERLHQHVPLSGSCAQLSRLSS